MVKKIVMTIPYNITYVGGREYLKDCFNIIWDDNNKIYQYILLDKYTYNKDNQIILSSQEFNKFSLILFNTLFDIYPNLKSTIKYFNDIIGLINKLNIDVQWITPSGNTIIQKYIKMISITHQTKLLKNVKSLTISIPTNNIDTKRQSSAFMPNLIHSLDASNIQLLVYLIINLPFEMGSININNDIPLYTIHDCFASNIENINKIETLVKSAFIDMYFNVNYLIKLHNN